MPFPARLLLWPVVCGGYASVYAYSEEHAYPHEDHVYEDYKAEATSARDGARPRGLAVGKYFREAKLEGANPRKTNLSDMNLINARLDSADLRGTIMYVPPLYLGENVFPSNTVFPSDRLPDTVTNRARFDGAKYDDSIMSA